MKQDFEGSPVFLLFLQRGILGINTVLFDFYCYVSHPEN